MNEIFMIAQDYELINAYGQHIPAPNPQKFWTDEESALRAAHAGYFCKGDTQFIESVFGEKCNIYKTMNLLSETVYLYIWCIAKA